MTPAFRDIVDREIVAQNEHVARQAYEQGQYVLCFLLAHSLVESLLRAFLDRADREMSFSSLIKRYQSFLEENNQREPVFVKELTQFNRRRNRLVHNLWCHGYSRINAKLEPACRAAFVVYGLLIEWLETFDPEITELGFDYER